MNACTLSAEQVGSLTHQNTEPDFEIDTYMHTYIYVVHSVYVAFARARAASVIVQNAPNKEGGTRDLESLLL